jgi:hypothetical protein
LRCNIPCMHARNLLARALGGSARACTEFFSHRITDVDGPIETLVFLRACTGMHAMYLYRMALNRLACLTPAHSVVYPTYHKSGVQLPVNTNNDRTVTGWRLCGMKGKLTVQYSPRTDDEHLPQPRLSSKIVGHRLSGPERVDYFVILTLH